MKGKHKMKTVVVLSGGLDSSVLLAKIKREFGDVEALTFDYGSKHNDREFVSAQAICAHYGVPLKRITLGFIPESFKSDLLKTGGDIPEGHYADESMKSTVVPFRNGIMLAIAAGYAESIGAKQVALGNHFGDHAIYPDCRADFARAMAQAITAGTYEQIQLLSPFCNITKTQIVTIGKELSVPMELTWSCYKGLEKHCGKCGTCVERIEAFREAGVADPTEYLA